MAITDLRKYKTMRNAAVFVRDTGEDEEALHVYGEVDMTCEGDLIKAIDDVAKANKPILVDLTYCTYMDSRAIHVLQKANMKWQLRVAAASGSVVQRIFEILHAGQFMDITYQDVPNLVRRNEGKRKANS